MSVFFLAVFLHSICALLIVFVLPESLTDAKARIARLRYKAEKDEKVNDPVLLCVLKEATRFLSALSVLLPRDTIGGTAHRQSRRDWNLFFLTMCYGLNTSFHVSMMDHRFLYNVLKVYFMPGIIAISLPVCHWNLQLVPRNCKCSNTRGTDDKMDKPF